MAAADSRRPAPFMVAGRCRERGQPESCLLPSASRQLVDPAPAPQAGRLASMRPPLLSPVARRGPLRPLREQRRPAVTLQAAPLLLPLAGPLWVARGCGGGKALGLGRASARGKAARSSARLFAAQRTLRAVGWKSFTDNKEPAECVCVCVVLCCVATAAARCVHFLGQFCIRLCESGEQFSSSELDGRPKRRRRRYQQVQQYRIELSIIRARRAPKGSCIKRQARGISVVPVVVCGANKIHGQLLCSTQKQEARTRQQTSRRRRRRKRENRSLHE